MIDDHITTLEMMEKWLSRNGYEVMPFNKPIRCPFSEPDSEQCIKENRCADIYLSDFDMPSQNGLELLQKQTRIGCKIDTRNKAIISGSVDDELKMQIRKLGYKFFDKPIELSELSDWLKECEKRVDLSQSLSMIEG